MDLRTTGNAGEGHRRSCKNWQENLKAKNFEEAEKTADSILKMIGVSAQAPAHDIPEEVRKKLRHELGSSFLVFRDKVQEELKLTKEQKEKLEQHLRELLPDALQVLPEDRRPEAGGARKRTRSIPPEGAGETGGGAEGNPQRRPAHAPASAGAATGGAVRRRGDLERTASHGRAAEAIRGGDPADAEKIEPLLEEAQKGGNPEEIRPKVLKLREDLQGKLEALLTDAQKKQWKEMLGKPVDLGVLFDDVSSR